MRQYFEYTEGQTHLPSSSCCKAIVALIATRRFIKLANPAHLTACLRKVTGAAWS